MRVKQRDGHEFDIEFIDIGLGDIIAKFTLMGHWMSPSFEIQIKEIHLKEYIKNIRAHEVEPLHRASYN